MIKWLVVIDKNNRIFVPVPIWMVLFAKYIIVPIIVPRYASFLHKQKITVNFDQLVV